MASDRANPEILVHQKNSGASLVLCELTQDGVGEELLLERRVPGVADDEGPEDGADTSTRSSNTDGGSSSSNELGSRVNVLLGSGGVDEVGGLHGGGPQAPPGSHTQAGRDRETGDSGHDDAGGEETGVLISRAARGWQLS